MATDQRLLLLSRARSLAPALRAFAAERSLQLVRATDAKSAFRELENGVSCALFDLDALGDAAEEFLNRVRGLKPALCAVGFGRMAESRPAASLVGYPVLSKPLTRQRLARAFEIATEETTAGRPAAPARPRSEPAGFMEDSTREELRTRVAQLTTLYQIGRAIRESRNWSEALDYFLATLRDYLHVRGAGILLYSREARVLAPRTVLSMAPHDVDAAARHLLAAYPSGSPTSEIHPLDCYASGGSGPHCVGHDGRWHLTVLPLRYRRTPLGFLLLDKPYTGGAGFASELFFLQTIQTILAEEVANAVQFSRLVDLKNFNEAVLDNVESGVLTANERGEIGYLNRRARQILGLGPAEDPPKNFDAIFRSGGGPVFERLTPAAEGGISIEGELLGEDGVPVPVQLRASRTTNPGDSEDLVVVAFEDLRDRLEMEEQIRRADRLRSLGELSAAIAHEVRNPLQGIALTLSNLQERVQPGGEPHVQVIFSEIERLNGIVNGILAFARPAPPEPQEVPLQPLCERVLELASDHASGRDVRLVLDLAPGENTCEMDAGQMLQVLLNVVRNGIDASPEGGQVVLRVSPTSVRVRGPAEPFWCFEVHDDGAGIPNAIRSKLFDPFFTTKKEGTGLGLAVSQKIVEEHRGVIHVDSRPGAGTTFAVLLPRHFAKGRAVPLQSSHGGA